MKTIIHVNQHVVRANKKKGEDNPPITVKTYKSNTYCKSVEIEGPAIVKYDPKGLSCGARVWIETQSKVTTKG